MRSTFHVFDSQLNAGRLTQKESTQANRWQELAERLSSKVDQLREISLSASAVRCWGARVSPETVHTSPNSAKPEPPQLYWCQSRGIAEETRESTKQTDDMNRRDRPCSGVHRV